MPKKRVSVTLRKPGSPRAPEAANAPVTPEASAVESVVSRVAEAPEASALENVVARATAQSAEAPVDSVTQSVEVDTSAVESAVLRAAEVPLPPSTVEAFVSGAAAALEKATTEIPAQQLESVLRRGPAGYRELTIYLPEKLAEELTVHCLARNLDLNRLIATAVEQLLRLANAVPEPAGTPEPSARKSRRSRLLSLAEWVRAVLAARRPSWLLGNPTSVSTS